MRKHLLVFAVVATLSFNPVCAERTIPASWPKDCVGRLQMALPGEADQSAILGRERFRDVAQFGVPITSFQDGEEDGWAGFSIELATLSITHPLSETERRQVISNVSLGKRVSLINDVKVGRNIVWNRMSSNQSSAYGASFHFVDAGFLVTNGVFFSWSGDAAGDQAFTKLKAELQSIVSGLRPRSLFDIPSEPGLCFPYLFVPDKGHEKHSVSMSYRLKDHPDMVINLQSETAEAAPKPGGDIRPDAVTNDFRTDLFWGTVTAPGRLKSARSLWHLPAKRSMQLASRPGIETFLAVVRNHAAEEDYIYLAVARGDPDHPEAAPDIRLFVKQQRANAIKRGVKPLTQDEVLTLARQIAASVKPRVSP